MTLAREYVTTRIAAVLVVVFVFNVVGKCEEQSMAGLHSIEVDIPDSDVDVNRIVIRQHKVAIGARGRGMAWDHDWIWTSPVDAIRKQSLLPPYRFQEVISFSPKRIVPLQTQAAEGAIDTLGIQLVDMMDDGRFLLNIACQANFPDVSEKAANLAANIVLYDESRKHFMPITRNGRESPANYSQALRWFPKEKVILIEEGVSVRDGTPYHPSDDSLVGVGLLLPMMDRTAISLYPQVRSWYRRYVVSRPRILRGNESSTRRRYSVSGPLLGDSFVGEVDTRNWPVLVFPICEQVFVVSNGEETRIVSYKNVLDLTIPGKVAIDSDYESFRIGLRSAKCRADGGFDFWIFDLNEYAKSVGRNLGDIVP